jgi:uncharacterized membrane protein YesL
MQGARLVLRALSDTFEQLITYIIATLGWWLCLLLIVPAPAGTLALFAHTDPRHGTLTDRMSFEETVRFVLENLWRGWRLVLITMPLTLLLLHNLIFYWGTGSVFSAFAPVWIVLLVVIGLVSLTAVSLAAMESLRAVEAVKAAVPIVIGRFPTVLAMLLVLVIVILFGSVLVVPAILFLPATIAATFNRLALTSRRIEIPNANAPTPERLAEGKERRKWWGP